MSAWVDQVVLNSASSTRLGAIAIEPKLIAAIAVTTARPDRIAKATGLAKET
jgi:hypothetical protein